MRPAPFGCPRTSKLYCGFCAAELVAAAGVAEAATLVFTPLALFLSSSALRRANSALASSSVK